MNNTSLSITVDARIEKKAEENAKKLGVSFHDLKQAITNKWLQEFAEKKEIKSSINISLVEEPNEYFKKSIKKSTEDIETGKGSPVFKSAKESIEWLEKQGI